MVFFCDNSNYFLPLVSLAYPQGHPPPIIFCTCLVCRISFGMRCHMQSFVLFSIFFTSCCHRFQDLQGRSYVEGWVTMPPFLKFFKKYIIFLMFLKYSL